jgi:hypothetical protein
MTEEEKQTKIREIMDRDDEEEEEEEKKEGADGEESEDSYDSYDPDEYDENGNYIWGKEGDDWEFYYEEDKQAFENGESTVSNCLNPEMLPQKGTPLGEFYAKSTAISANGEIIRASYAKDGAFYVTRKKGKATKGT